MSPVIAVWHDVRRVAIPDVEHVVGLVIMGANQVAVQRHVVAQQRVGHHALAAPKYLREWRAFTVGRSTLNF
jgi:hypothetical protein